ncbi:MAG: response regulator [Eubacteriales bacterium]
MADWIIIVDDDIMNLKSAGKILSKNHMRVTALRSGQALLDYLASNEFPDLILLDINMPGMGGFETLKKLREMEKDREETPVIFLTAANDLEAEIMGLQMGAMDYIRKPFIPDVLTGRVQRVLRTQERLHWFEQAAMIDRMTGFLNKEATEKKMKELCSTETGFLCVLDLDTFKPVNDLYGHDTGDQILVLFTALLQKEMRYDDVCGRIGGDEFVLFIRNMKKEEELSRFVNRVNEAYALSAKKLIGPQVPLGVSVGAVAVPEHGREYEQLFHMADEALYNVKQNGRHGCCVYGSTVIDSKMPAEELDLEAITMILEERSAPSSAMWMGKEAFISIYRYMTRYMERYHGVAYRTLFTIRMTNEDCKPEERAEVMAQFRKLMQNSLRNSDIMVEISDRQLFMLLPETKDYNIGLVIGRLLDKWNQSECSSKAKILYETGQVHLHRTEGAEEAPLTDRVVVVDDDPVNLRFAEHILQRENMEVIPLQSGEELLEYLKKNNPDLILLDIMMPGMDGFETIRQMRVESLSARDIPVIFLTSDDSRETETQGLQMGAMDFIRKPFVPDVLMLRVKHAIELTRLQNNLSLEVSKKTHENNLLFFQIVRSLTEAIDAKDTYTNGHSGRVAEYAEMIAKRCDYTDEQLNNLYMMGLVHDVGKIGVPDAVINKPGKLTAEEYEIIKTHPVLGAKILGTIQGMPTLYTGARWHHERYDGTGYPDGLAGEKIPEEARIIAVADAYDAMTSRRSYRDALSQETVRNEIMRGRGSQFDPRFADIMLKLIDEDQEYKLRERTLLKDSSLCSE